MNCLKLIGQKYGRLVVVGFCGTRKGRSLWRCQCHCGRYVVKNSHNLRSDRVSSCGCKVLKHGDWVGGKPTTEWKTWDGMKQRCTNAKSKDWKQYGGRGIKVCFSWLMSFESFLADMGRKPGPEYSIDRINNDGNYEPSNCRWATRSEQMSNQRRQYA